MQAVQAEGDPEPQKQQREVNIHFYKGTKKTSYALPLVITSWSDFIEQLKKRYSKTENFSCADTIDYDWNGTGPWKLDSQETWDWMCKKIGNGPIVVHINRLQPATFLSTALATPDTPTLQQLHSPTPMPTASKAQEDVAPVLSLDAATLQQLHPPTPTPTASPSSFEGTVSSRSQEDAATRIKPQTATPQPTQPPRPTLSNCLQHPAPRSYPTFVPAYYAHKPYQRRSDQHQDSSNNSVDNIPSQPASDGQTSVSTMSSMVENQRSNKRRHPAKSDAKNLDGNTDGNDDALAEQDSDPKKRFRMSNNEPKPGSKLPRKPKFWQERIAGLCKVFPTIFYTGVQLRGKMKQGWEYARLAEGGKIQAGTKNNTFDDISLWFYANDSKCGYQKIFVDVQGEWRSILEYEDQIWPKIPNNN